MNPQDILSSLRRALTEDALDIPPPHMKTAVQWSKEWNLSRKRTSELLQRAVATGRFEVKPYRVVTGARGVYPTPHYGPVKKPKNP